MRIDRVNNFFAAPRSKATVQQGVAVASQGIPRARVCSVEAGNNVVAG
jgi:hypothetical protein